MVAMIKFFVSGSPSPKGSWRPVRAGGKIHLIPQNPKGYAAWDKAIKFAAHTEMVRNGLTMTNEPVSITMRFYLQKPKYLKGKFSRHYKRPDVDKLARFCDSLTGIVYKDDSQIDAMYLSKEYAEEGSPTGCQIEVN